ncbi:hypothetical protein HanPSC8_Chr06g0263641 [Helianthus annuus]|nr:hypothetical protein HanIR_Chr06g0293321 [Helianthus annuus]KAJ0916602.1 hypothetical protein HanPSC8_Chr06g0263641 [Helianthus annuus]
MITTPYHETCGQQVLLSLNSSIQKRKKKNCKQRQIQSIYSLTHSTNKYACLDFFYYFIHACKRIHIDKKHNFIKHNTRTTLRFPFTFPYLSFLTGEHPAAGCLFLRPLTPAPTSNLL